MAVTKLQSAVAEVRKHTDTLDYIYINAGALVGMGHLTDLSPSDLSANLTTNVVGPHNILRAFSPLIVASKSTKRVISITSSLVGSVTALPHWSQFVKGALDIDYLPMSGYAVSK